MSDTRSVLLTLGCSVFVSVFGSSFGVGARSLALVGGRPVVGTAAT